MPNYSPILDAELVSGQPLTQSLLTRLRDNPLALYGQGYTEVTGSGSYSVPTDVNLLDVIIVGGGGGGGGGYNLSPFHGGGGGAGGQVWSGLVDVAGRASIGYGCGAGGAGGAIATNGVKGVSSYFGSVDSGTTTSATANKLVQTGQNFLSTVSVGDYVINTSAKKYTTVTAIDSNTTLSLSDDIMGSGQSYVIVSSDGGFAMGGGGGGAGQSGAVGAGGFGQTNSSSGRDGSLFGFTAEDALKPINSTASGGKGGISALSRAGGGGGGVAELPKAISTTSLGDGGDGGDGTVAGSNATNYGAGGGGGGGDVAGGSGSDGIIFILPLQS